MTGSRVFLRIPDKRGGWKTVYEATPRQEEFHLSTAPNTLYGGAAGGGKSTALRRDAEMRCLSVPGYRCLLLRRTFPELRNTHIDRLIFEAKELGGEFFKSENIARFPNGSTIEVGHCEDEASVAKYLSTEYDWIGFDELVTFTRNQFAFISSRARSTKPGVLPMVRAGSNPGGANSYWVKRYFILRDITKAEVEGYDPSEWAFIPARLDDNPHIDASYEKRLMTLPTEALRRAYRYGDWDVFEGQAFTEWRAVNETGQAWHVLTELPEIEGRPINEDPRIEVFRALDWGYRDYGVCGWYACLPDGRLIKTQEYLFREMLARDVAQEIRDRSRGMKIRYTVADPSIWIRDPVAGESIAETFAKWKVPLLPADNDRINGWHRLHSYLRETTTVVTPEKGIEVPMLQFYGPGCPYTVRTIPSMTVSSSRPEDIETKNVEDHAADETRYAVMSRPAPSRWAPAAPQIDPTFRLSGEAKRLLREARRVKRPGWVMP